MNVVLLGATRGMGRSLARQMAARGDRLFLLGRRLDDLERSAADLRARAEGADVAVAHCDLLQPAGFAPALAAAAAHLGRVDCVVVTAAQLVPQEELERDLERTRELLTGNYVNTVLFCEHARQGVLRDGGTLCVFSSVAGDRARKPVLLYGSAKAGLSAYLEGLDHKFRSSGLRTVCVKPGFVRTSMTAGMKMPPFSGDPDDVAARVLRAIDRGTPVVYAPAAWRWVMWVIRRLPRAVMRRVGF